MTDDWLHASDWSPLADQLIVWEVLATKSSLQTRGMSESSATLAMSFRRRSLDVYTMTQNKHKNKLKLRLHG